MTDLPSTLRVGVAGLGAAAADYLPELAACPRATLVAAADPRVVARETFARDYGGEVFESVEAMCASPNVDLVYILTPNRLHARHAALAAEHGKQIIVDKPLGVTLAECDAAIEAADRNGVRLLVGHSQCLDRHTVMMAELALGGTLGAVLALHNWSFTDWLYKPRDRYELDPAQGEGLVLRQGPPQIDMLRMAAGGKVRSVRAMTKAPDPARPIEGTYTAYLEFEDGTPATAVHSALGHLDSSELTYGIGRGGLPWQPDAHLRSRQAIARLADAEAEVAAKERGRYGYASAKAGADGTLNPAKRHALFGLTVVSCERGDIRQTPTGLLVHGDEARWEIPVSAGPGYSERFTHTEFDLMYDAWINDKPLASHDGYWGKATVEVCLAIQESTRTRSEVVLAHQTAYQPIPHVEW